MTPPFSMQAPRRESVQVDGIALSVVRFGRGAPVICLPAVGHDALDFAPLAERLGRNFEFICIEWPSHGGSGQDRLPASAARYCELVEAVLWQMSVRNPIVIGNSIGGAAGILYASRHAVRGLVLCDAGGLVEVNSIVAKFCNAFAKFFAAGARGALWFKPAFSLYYRFVLPSPAARRQRDRIVARAHELAPILAQAWKSFGDPSADIRLIAASLEMPIWIAWSKSDHVIPLKACMPAIKNMRTASLDVFSGGHSAFLEQPDEFATKFELFVARAAPSPSFGVLSVVAA